MRAILDRRIASTLLRGTIAAAAFAVPVFADHGRYLPDANPGGDARVHTWGNANPTSFDRSVSDSVKNLAAGDIKFDYDTYTLNPDGTNGGGAVLSGGFFMKPNIRVKSGFSLGWVQTVTATHAGDNEWNLPDLNAGEFPDADPRDRAPGTFGPDDTLLAPTYPFNRPAANNTGTNPTLGFQDFPARSFDDGNQSWTAELGLVCISNTAHVMFPNPNDAENPLFGREVRVIGSLLWGFNFQGLPVREGSPNIANVFGSSPFGWGAATTSYLNTLNNYYDGLGGGGGDDDNGGTLPALESDLYSFANNSNCFEQVPEPSSMALILCGVLYVARRRTKA